MIRATESNYHLLDDNVQAIADSVLTKVSEKNENFSIDPITIIAIINCIIGVIRLLYACRSKRGDVALQDLRDPNMFQRFIIKRQIRKHVDKEYEADVYDSMREHSHQMDETDVLNIINLYDSKELFKEA